DVRRIPVGLFGWGLGFGISLGFGIWDFPPPGLRLATDEIAEAPDDDVLAGERVVLRRRELHGGFAHDPVVGEREHVILDDAVHLRTGGLLPRAQVRGPGPFLQVARGL